MEISRAEAAAEALLFTMGRSITVEEFCGVLEIDAQTFVKLMHRLMDKYEAENRGVHIIELDGAYQMCTKPVMYDYIVKLTHQPKKHVLTDVMLETLSIVAYKQPVTKAVIEKIRGVSCEHAINRLVEYGLICEAGRLDAPGRPILFATTEEFLRVFGLRSQDELPVIDAVKMAEFKEEAEEEAQMDIPV